MFCSECGKEITDDSAFCGYCGSENLNKSDKSFFNQNEKNFNQREINKKLAQYNELTESIICPDCGYKGPMGILKNNISPIYRRVLSFILTILAVEFISTIMKLGTILYIIVCGLCFNFFNRVFKAKVRNFICPSCDQELTDK